jgi:hypothetical protein
MHTWGDTHGYREWKWERVRWGWWLGSAGGRDKVTGVTTPRRQDIIAQLKGGNWWAGKRCFEGRVQDWRLVLPVVSIRSRQRHRQEHRRGTMGVLCYAVTLHLDGNKVRSFDVANAVDAELPRQHNIVRRFVDCEARRTAVLEKVRVKFPA